MTVDDFWAIIERSRRGAHSDPDRQLSQLRAILEKLHPDEIVAFGGLFHQLHGQSYYGHLWGAAYLINGGCSDDAFDYFRGWLIAQGRTVYESALKDPDSLVSVAREDETELEEMLYLPRQVYEACTKLDDYYDRLPPNRYRELPGEEFASWSDGQGDIDPTKARQAYPKLFKKFGQYLEEA